jgi:5'-3' exonuclease
MNLNVVIDASGMFYRSLFTLGNYGAKKGEKLLESKQSQGMFMRKLATDFSSIVRNIDNISRVIICLDSHSWRKNIKIEVSPGKEGEYKGDREEKKQDSPIAWNIFYDLCEKFANIMNEKGYIISKLQDAEADDLLFLWSRKFNREGENVILVTGDRDLLQTVCHNNNGTWTVSLDPVNKRKKISLTQETFDKKDENSSDDNVDIFSPDSWADSGDTLKMLLDSYELNIIDPMQIAIQKVILGDGGDSVPGIITWMDSKPNKNGEIKPRSMTENNFGKIIEVAPGIRKCNWKDLKEGMFLEEISSKMEELKKIKVDRDLVLENINRNCILVILDEEIIPNEIQIAFEHHSDNVPCLIPVTTRDGILNGTEYWKDKKEIVPKTYDLFSNLDE